MARRFDAQREELTGEHMTVAQDLNRTSGGVLVDVKQGLPVGVKPAPFSASENGVLVFHTNATANKRLVWFTRSGDRLGASGEADDYMQLQVSPDEQWAAAAVRYRGSWDNWDLLLLDLTSGVSSRLTSGAGRKGDLAWSPQSDRIIYSHFQVELGEQVDLMEIVPGNRALPPKRVFTDGHSNKPESWSPDGRVILYRRDEQTLMSLSAVNFSDPAVIMERGGIKSGFRFSPDGNWVAYSFLQEDPQIFVSRFPSMTDTRQVSADGGFAPAWRKDGKELYFMSRTGEVMAVDVTASASSLQTSAAKLLFRTENRTPSMPQFAAIDNGRKFLVIEVPPARLDGEKMVVITNWTSLLQLNGQR